MRRFLVIALGTSAAVALAQNRIDVLLEQNVVTTDAIIRFAGDGGCSFQAAGVARYDGGLELRVVSEPYAFNVVRCGAIQDAAARAVKRAMGVGDGGLP